MSAYNYNSPEYQADHRRVRQKWGKAVDYFCDRCERIARDWAHVHGTDKTEPDNYMPLCRYCHKDYDRPEWLKEERRRERARIEQTAAYKGWSPERREAQRQRMLKKWSDPKVRQEQAQRAKKDMPWKGRRPANGGGFR